MAERWKPSVTVAAIVERDGRYLLVEEETPEGLRLNNPAGHLDPGESLLQGVVRETLEETARRFEPIALVGVYLSRFRRPSRAAFDEFYERWMPRVYRFVARRLRTRAEAEAVTRATLEAAVRAGLAAGDAELATSLLALARAEIARGS
jgi:ADP-ribose pyrophosphatase YjhB (NUDIX family)